MVNAAVESSVRRRQDRRRVSDKKRAAALFRLWHDARHLIDLGERLGESELVHLLGVTQLLIEERAASLGSGGPALGDVDQGLPN